jgi:hypothetical protein
MEKKIQKMFVDVVGCSEFDSITFNNIISDISNKTNMPQSDVIKIIQKNIRQSNISGNYYVIKKKSKKK